MCLIEICSKNLKYVSVSVKQNSAFRILTTLRKRCVKWTFFQGDGFKIRYCFIYPQREILKFKFQRLSLLPLKLILKSSDQV